MFKHIYILALGSLVFGAVSASAGIVTIDFGTGANVVGPYPGDSNASNSEVGVGAGFSSLGLDGGLFVIRGANGSGAENVFCDQGTATGDCGADIGGSLTGSTAYGLGVGNGRVDPGETLTLTVVGGNLSVILESFSVSGFSNGEELQYSLDGRTAAVVDGPANNTGLDTVTVTAGTFANTIKFSIPAGNEGNFSLSSLTLSVTQNPVPEPATFSLAGFALLGIGMVGRRLRHS
jgi:hypothetical protein